MRAAAGAAPEGPSPRLQLSASAPPQGEWCCSVTKPREQAAKHNSGWGLTQQQECNDENHKGCGPAARIPQAAWGWEGRHHGPRSEQRSACSAAAGGPGRPLMAEPPCDNSAGTAAPPRQLAASQRCTVKALRQAPEGQQGHPQREHARVVARVRKRHGSAQDALAPACHVLQGQGGAGRAGFKVGEGWQRRGLSALPGHALMLPAPRNSPLDTEVD